MNQAVRLLGAVFVTSLAVIVGTSQGQDATTAARPIPPAKLRINQPVVRIAMTVLEVDGEKQTEFESKIKQVLPSADLNHVAVMLDQLDGADRDGLIRELVQKNIASVISRPQVMTISGQTATVQVGEQVPPSLNLKSKDGVTPVIGLTIQCTPHVRDDHEKVRLDFHLSKSALEESPGAKPLPRISQRYVSTAVELKSRETIALKGPAGKDSLLVFITPTVNPAREDVPKPMPVAYASPLAARRSAATEDDRFAKLQATIRELFPEEEILVRQLNQAVLLRGSVSERSLPVILSIAEDYVPKVINDLVVAKAKARIANPATPRVLQPVPSPKVIRQPLPSRPVTPDPYRPTPPATPPGIGPWAPAKPQYAQPPADAPLNRSYGNVVPPAKYKSISPVPSAKLIDEIRQLRGEVKMLRQEVKKVIEMLQKETAQLPAETTRPRDRKPVKAATEPWRLTLPDILSIAQQNSPKEVRYLLKDAYDHSDQGKQVRAVFEELRRAQAESLAAQAAARAAETVKADSASNRSGLRLDAYSSHRAMTGLTNLLIREAALEKELRSLMGLPEIDGRRITPVGKPESD